MSLVTGSRKGTITSTLTIPSTTVCTSEIFVILSLALAKARDSSVGLFTSVIFVILSLCHCHLSLAVGKEQ